MKVAIGFHNRAIADWAEFASYALEAERLGADTAWAAEAWSYDAATPLAYLAAKTSRIRLGAGIFQAGTRTPALVAMTAMSLASMSDNRFILGFGTSGPQVIEGWHGIPFRRPVQRMREVIEIVRKIMGGERAVYKGKVYTLPLPTPEARALHSGAPANPNIPIYLASLGPSSLRLAGELADGWLGASFMPEHASVFFDHIAEGARKAGRGLADLDLQAGGSVAISDDVDRLVAARRPGLAFSLGAMGSREHNFYNLAYQRAGYQEAATRVQSLWLEGRRVEAADAVPEEMVLQSSILGTEAMVKDRVRLYRDAGITTLRVDPAGGTLKERLDTLGRVLDIVREVSAETPAAAPRS